MSNSHIGDYYSILGLSRNCSAEDIKKAYRKQALKWHPDKNPDNQSVAEVHFKQVAEAYEILSDPQKRKIYDLYGKSALTGEYNEFSNSRSNNRFDGQFTGFPGFFSEAYDPFGFSSFHFKDPFEVFNTFFGSFDGGNYNSGGDEFWHTPLSRRSQNTNTHFNNFFGNFNNFGGFNGDNFGGSSSSVQESISTQNINGRTRTVKTRVANGEKTVEIIENGVLVSKTINGVAQDLKKIKY